MDIDFATIIQKHNPSFYRRENNKFFAVWDCFYFEIIEECEPDRVEFNRLR